MNWGINYLKVIIENNIKRNVKTISQSLLMGVVPLKENVSMNP